MVSERQNRERDKNIIGLPYRINPRNPIPRVLLNETGDNLGTKIESSTTAIFLDSGFSSGNYQAVGKKSKMEEIGISVQSQVSLVFSPFWFDM